MSGLRRIVNNTLISLFGQMVTWTSTLLLTIAYGRFLGDVKFGELYFAIAFVALVGFPIELGFNQQVTREVAEDPEKAQAYLWNTLLIKVTLWVPLYSIILFAARVLGYSQEQRSIVAICGITLLTASIVNSFAALHYAFERTLFPAVGMMLEKGLSACVGFILLKYGATVQTMAFVLLAGSLIDALWVAFWFFRLVGRRIVIKKAVIRKLVHTSIPFVIYGVLGVIYYRIDTVLLSLMTNAAVVGWYGAGYRLFDTLLFIPNLILNAVMYPVFVRLSGSRTALKMTVEKSMNLLLICAVPIAVLMIVAAPNIIGFLYHRAEFDNTIPVLQALAPGLVFLYINTLFSSIIISTKGERKIPIMAGIALVFNLSLNLFLIPRYQQVGAAVVTSLTELLLLCISASFVPRYLLPKGSLKVGGKVLIAALFMALTAFFLRIFSIFILAPIALLVYGGIAILLRMVPREDVEKVYQAIRKRGEIGSTEVLVNVVDENLYMQITGHIPAVRAVEDAATEHIPAVRAVEDAATEHIPAVREEEAQPELRGQLEEVETERLPVAKAKNGRLKKVRVQSLDVKE
jgi:O-antigen/teichoic acid export membrane protein